MNKEILEKMFDEKFPTLKESRFEGFNSMPNPKELKDFIFYELIKEVLDSMQVYEGHGTTLIVEHRKYANKVIKRKAKTLYGITL